jgi:hypothetical protein
MRVFIVLKWFYEGDSNLVDSFVGAKLTKKEALKLIASDDIVLNNNDFEIYRGESLPKEWGSYGDSSKYEIREVEL